MRIIELFEAISRVKDAKLQLHIVHSVKLVGNRDIIERVDVPTPWVTHIYHYQSSWPL